MIYMIENIWKSIDKPLKLICKFSKDTGYTINTQCTVHTQKMVVALYSNEQAEYKILKYSNYSIPKNTITDKI